MRSKGFKCCPCLFLSRQSARAVSTRETPTATHHSHDPLIICIAHPRTDLDETCEPVCLLSPRPGRAIPSWQPVHRQLTGASLPNHHPPAAPSGRTATPRSSRFFRPCPTILPKPADPGSRPSGRHTCPISTREDFAHCPLSHSLWLDFDPVGRPRVGLVNRIRFLDDHPFAPRNKR